MRKKAGLQKGQEIDLSIRADSEMIKRLKDYSGFIKERTNSRKFELTDKELKGFKNVVEEKIKEKNFSMGFSII